MKWWHLGGTELGMLFWVNLIIEKLHALLVNFRVGFNGEKNHCQSEIGGFVVIICPHQNACHKYTCIVCILYI